MSKLLVICAKRYNGHELWTLLGVLQDRGHDFEVVSQKTLIRDELTLRPNTLERTVYEVEDTKDFNAVVIVSGNMADTEAYWTDKHVLDTLIQFQYREDMPVIAAICCSVPTIAYVGHGINMSYFPLVRARHKLEQHGVIPSNTSITVDGRFITAENQMMTEMWAEEICNVLEGKPLQHVMTDSGFVPKGQERKMTPDVRAAIDESRGYPMILNKDKK